MGLPIVGDVIDAVKDIVSEVIVDRDKKNEILARIDERLHLETMAQIEVNRTEASSNSVFVAGWRPFTGWVGGVGLAYSAVVEPLASWLAKVIFNYSGSFPVINNELLLYILGGMLGLGGMRSFEKAKGVADNKGTPSIKLPNIFKKTKPVNLIPEDVPWMK